MKALAAIAALVASTACLADGRAAPAGLCTAQETTFFQCQVSKGRSINLCGDGAGAFQYRFGRGRIVELAFPGNAGNAGDGARQLLYSHYFRAQTDRHEVRFENGGVGYVVFDYHEDGRRLAGVHVTAADGKGRDIPCSGPVKGKLAVLKGVLKCDADSALNLGTCP